MDVEIRIATEGDLNALYVVRHRVLVRPGPHWHPDYEAFVGRDQMPDPEGHLTVNFIAVDGDTFVGGAALRLNGEQLVAAPVHNGLDDLQKKLPVAIDAAGIAECANVFVAQQYRVETGGPWIHANLLKAVERKFFGDGGRVLIMRVREGNRLGFAAPTRRRWTHYATVEGDILLYMTREI